MVPRKRFPAFIKPYYPPNNRKSLKLPPPFTSFVKEILPIKAVLLKDHHNGKFWTVEVAKVGGDLFFQAGWTKFLEDNSLEYGDFLIFQYNGGDEFHFKILRATAERRDTRAAMDFSSNEGLQDEDVEEAVQEQTGNAKKNTPEGEEEEVVEELEEAILIENLGKREGMSSGAKTRESSSTSSMANIAVEGLNSKAHGKATAVKSKDQDFRSNVNALQNPFHGLQNPYFLVIYRKYKSSEVYVPRDFVNTFWAQLLPKMIIRDPSGKEWSIKLHTRKNKTVWMRGGWGRLALHNNVKEEDCLACELVPTKDGRGSYLQLHIHRMTRELESTCKLSGH